MLRRTDESVFFGALKVYCESTYVALTLEILLASEFLVQDYTRLSSLIARAR